MTGPDIAITLAAALSGAGISYLGWAVWEALGPRRIVAPAAPDPAPRAEPAVRAQAPAPPLAEKPTPPPPPAAEPALAAQMAAQIAALRGDLAVIARAQAALLEGNEARDGRLLAELRAVISARDDWIERGIARIEGRLDGVTGERPAADDAAPGTDDDPDGDRAAQLIRMRERARPNAQPSAR